MDECGRESKWISLQSQPISVCILAISKSGRLLVQREYRPSVGEFVLGLPGGMVEEGEGILQAAVRELLEETGYVFETWKVIGEAWPLPGIFTQKTVFAKAENFQFQEKPTLQEAEMILAPEFLSPNEIIGQARDHGFVDGQLLAGLSLLHFSDQ